MLSYVDEELNTHNQSSYLLQINFFRNIRCHLHGFCQFGENAKKHFAANLDKFSNEHVCYHQHGP